MIQVKFNMIQINLPLRFFRGKKSRQAEHDFNMEKQTSKNYQENLKEG